MELQVFLKYFAVWTCCYIWESRGSIASGNNSEVALTTDSEVVTVRNGSAVQLNCTITGRGNGTRLVADDLFWSRGHTRLTSNTRVLNNRTIQLSINSASWNDGGEYWCRLSADPPMLRLKVSVIVGDLPSSPQNIRWSNFELLPLISWSAASYDGRLPVRYYVHYQCHGHLDCNSVETYDPCVSKHPSHHQYQCLVEYIAKGVKYTIWVTASNSVGAASSRALDVFVEFNDLASAHTFPPPRAQHMVTTTPQTRRSLTVRLTRRKNWNGYETSYNISYRREGESKFQVWCNRTQSDQLTLQGDLKPYTVYDVFISVRLVNTYGQVSRLSRAIGPFVGQTAEEAPSVGPTIVNCSAIAWPEEKGKMNVTVTWKPLPVAVQNGVLRKYVIIYAGRSGSFSRTIPVHNNTSLTQAKLSALNSSSSYDIWIQACTVECGSSSKNKCPVSLETLPTIRGPRSSNRTTLIAMLILLAVCVMIIIIVLCIYRRNSLSRLSRPGRSIVERIGHEGPIALRVPCGDPESYHGYESLEDENEDLSQSLTGSFI